MIKEIPKPIAREICMNYPRTQEELKMESHHISWKGFNEWFDETIEPLNKAIREGVEVYGPFETKEAGPSNSHTYLAKGHKALLIGVEKIKKESAADVLMEIVNKQEHGLSGCDLTRYLDRAKAALANEEQGDE